MPHTLAPDLGQGHLNTALIADDVAVAFCFVFAAVALPVTRGTEDLFAEKTVCFRFQRPVVDRLWLFNLTF